jgi:hypothetical protein
VKKEIFEGPARNFFVVPTFRSCKAAAAAKAKATEILAQTWGPTHFGPTHGVARAKCLCPSIPQSKK